MSVATRLRGLGGWLTSRAVSVVSPTSEHAEDHEEPSDFKRVELAIQALIDESIDLGKAIRELLMTADRFLAIAGAIIIGSLTLALFQKQRVVLIGLPFALSMIYTYVIQNYTEVLSRAGHKRAIEERINCLLRQEVMVAETRVAPTRAGRLSVTLTFVTAALLVLASAVAGFAVLRGYNDGWLSWLRWVDLVALATPLLAILFAIREMNDAMPKAYEAAKAAFVNSGLGQRPGKTLTGR